MDKGAYLSAKRLSPASSFSCSSSKPARKEDEHEDDNEPNLRANARPECPISRLAPGRNRALAPFLCVAAGILSAVEPGILPGGMVVLCE